MELGPVLLWHRQLSDYVQLGPTTTTQDMYGYRVYGVPVQSQWLTLALSSRGVSYDTRASAGEKTSHMFKITVCP